jgi:hypothetical protein
LNHHAQLRTIFSNEVLAVKGFERMEEELSLKTIKKNAF